MTTQTMNNKKSGFMKREIELREAVINEDDNKKILEGYAVTFDSPTVLYEIDGVEYKEIIKKSAFDNANFKDCCLKYNHGDSAFILARTRGGSLEINVDDYGLKFRATLPDTSSAKDIYELVKGGLIDRCSFAFRCEEDSYDRESHTRTILKIKRVYDLSVVDIPAYDDTNVEARSFFDAEREKEHASDEARRVRELICRTYL